MILCPISLLVGLLCYVLVLVKMFQNGYTALAIASILTLFICGVGYLLAFGFGWTSGRSSTPSSTATATAAAGGALPHDFPA
jgi:hypothetical protein